MRFELLFCLFAALLAVSDAFPPPTTCQINDADPKPVWDSIPKAIVNLDSAPQDRWTAIATQYKDQIGAMVNEFVGHISKFPGKKWEVSLCQ